MTRSLGKILLVVLLGLIGHPERAAGQAMLEVREGDASGPLIGNGSAAASGRDFGQWGIDIGPTPARTLYVENTGTGFLSLAAPLLGGTGASAFFLVTGGFSTGLASGESTTFSAAFDPSTLSLINAAVSFGHDAQNTLTPFAINFEGEGVVVVPSVPSLSPLGMTLLGSLLALAACRRLLHERRRA